MAKTSRRPSARAAKAGKPKRATRAMKRLARTRTVPDEEAHIDACDLEVHESEATPDADLPEARGGVEVLRGTRGRTTHQRI
jgi:hypothetical protein